LSKKSHSEISVRFHSLLVNIVNDLGGKGALSTGQLQLAKRCAWVSVQCEALERKEIFEPADVTAYVSMMSNLARTLKTLGLKRQPRDVTPTLQSYLEARKRQIEAEAEKDAET
jgi:hypothetical protein